MNVIREFGVLCELKVTGKKDYCSLLGLLQSESHLLRSVEIVLANDSDHFPVAKFNVLFTIFYLVSQWQL